MTLQHRFAITGIHCPACKMLIEDVVGDMAGITRATVDEHAQLLTIESETPLSASEWIASLSAQLKPFNYSLSLL